MFCAAKVTLNRVLRASRATLPSAANKDEGVLCKV